MTKWRFLWAALCAAFGFSFFLAAGNVSVLMFPTSKPQSDPIFVFVVAVCFIISGVAYSMVRFKQRTFVKKSSIASLQDFTFDRDELERLVPRNGDDVLKPEQLTLFLNCVVEPAGVVERISERVSPAHTSIMVDTTFSLRVQVATEQAAVVETSFLVPLQFPKKGHHASGLKAYGIDDKRISTVSHSNVIVFEIAVMRRIARMVAPEFLDQYCSRIESLVIAVLTSASPSPEHQVTEVFSLIKSVSEEIDTEEPIDETALTQLQNLFDRLNGVLPLCISFSRKQLSERAWPDVLRVRLERRVAQPVTTDVHGVPSGRGAELLDGVTRIWEHIRLAAGVRPSRLYFEIGNLRLTRSYHLEMQGPEGTYYSSSGIWGQHHIVDGLPGDVSKPEGQRRMHVYFRDAAIADLIPLGPSWPGYVRALPAPRIFMSADFEERSPGSLASPMFAAAATVGLVAAIAARHQITPVGVPINDLPLIGLLCAVPIAAAALAGFDAGKDHRRPQMPSRIVPIFTAVIAVLGVVLAIGQRSGAKIGTFDPDQAWLMLLAAAVLNLVMAGGSWLGRVRAEHHLTKKSGTKKGT
ncbi:MULTISPECIES: hypothetical protein [unclassified Rathayibacter]|uniref:hypothetical protein n=1 Tax=unclassified Rathayibacter TaxID=2609250 RepID=UPI001042F64E|nr:MULTISPECIES: hypothetical protein [unclassified Rathayibacter]MCJ1703993.1 hypothetical protein [Rathayibacter sp. VKM Ac-2926]TCL82476.1 hypothetical protein EDF49_10530 [Rathayibacter sp. PhB192]TCM27815.1 hypothetical protein EDF43_10530 [Rathayibacter sp. PhB179]